MAHPGRQKPEMVERVVITEVWPATPDGVSDAKGTIGHPLIVRATAFADGHDIVAARARLRAMGHKDWSVIPMRALGNDRYEGSGALVEIGRHQLEFDGWVDAHATWRHRLEAKIGAGQDVGQELEEGAQLIESDLDRVATALAAEAADAVTALRRGDPSPALRTELAAALSALPDRRRTTTSAVRTVWVDREVAAVGSWYELFPRSYGGLRAVMKRLPAVAEMGFTVLYLPPIHPIGTTARKGPGNSLDSRPGDPGSPWAIGSPDGGHDSIAPELGTIEDFDDLVTEARAHDLEVALDYALQCSPDHPWVAAHPEWFAHRPDGTIRFAENPPKQYQDIYPIEFLPADDADRVALWQACRDVLEHWIAHGVRIFRVDNPHTKPFAFWQWLLEDVRGRHPDVVFLAEAFTRPAAMHRLAEIGFSQSYTYFTWRTTKAELTEYGEELAHGPDSAYFRPNLWPNTPDILSGPLRGGPPAAFVQRAVLAATLGPSWGMYSGYELCENVPASDTNEEYSRSEKYELKHRDWDDPGSIAPVIARLNDIRRRHPALSDLASLRFHHASSDAIIVYSKQVGVDAVLCVVCIEPEGAHEASLWIDLGALSLPWDAPLDAFDELSLQHFSWHGPEPYVRLDPTTPAHVIHLAERAGSRP